MSNQKYIRPNVETLVYCLLGVSHDDDAFLWETVREWSSRIYKQEIVPSGAWNAFVFAASDSFSLSWFPEMEMALLPYTFESIVQPFLQTDDEDQKNWWLEAISIAKATLPSNNDQM